MRAAAPLAGVRYIEKLPSDRKGDVKGARLGSFGIISVGLSRQSYASIPAAEIGARGSLPSEVMLRVISDRQRSHRIGFNFASPKRTREMV